MESSSPTPFLIPSLWIGDFSLATPAWATHRRTPKYFPSARPYPSVYIYIYKPSLRSYRWSEQGNFKISLVPTTRLLSFYILYKPSARWGGSSTPPNVHPCTLGGKRSGERTWGGSNSPPPLFPFPPPQKKIPASVYIYYTRRTTLSGCTNRMIFDLRLVHPTQPLLHQ